MGRDDGVFLMSGAPCSPAGHTRGPASSLAGEDARVGGGAVGGRRRRRFGSGLLVDLGRHRRGGVVAVLFLQECLGDDGRQMFGELERFYGGPDRRDARGELVLERRGAARLLEHAVLVLLRQQVADPVGVRGLPLGDALRARVVDHRERGDLDAADGDGRRAAVFRPAAVGDDGDFAVVVGDERHINADDVGELVQRAHVARVDADLGERVDRDAEEVDRERELVDRHVLEHALGVALEALGERLVGVRVERRQRDDRVLGLLGDGEGLAEVGRDVLDEAHDDGHAALLGERRHRLELRDRRRAGLLEDDVRRARVDRAAEQRGVVDRAARDEREALFLLLLRRRGATAAERVGHVGRERDGLLGGPRLDDILSERAPRVRVAPAAEEPRLDDVGQARRRARAREDLLRVEPPHAAPGQPRSDDRDVDDVRVRRRRHHDAGAPRSERGRRRANPERGRRDAPPEKEQQRCDKAHCWCAMVCSFTGLANRGRVVVFFESTVGIGDESRHCVPE
mmetsp:Transcript_16556/g.66826  ORF Transcript_16556/g.66826 Transcript_16556/m.66826 type:complete len:513 (-) Transcript_16556:66-1604(-)